MQLFSVLSAILPALLSVDGLAAIGAGIAAFTGVGAGIAMGMTAGKAVDGIARQPEAEKKIRGAMMLGLAFAETTAIYGVLVAILIMVL